MQTVSTKTSYSERSRKSRHRFHLNHFACRALSMTAGAAALLSGFTVVSAAPLAPHVATAADIDAIQASVRGTSHGVIQRSRQPRPIITPIQLAAPLDLSGGYVTLKGHQPAVVSASQRIGAPDSSTPMSVELFLQPRDRQGMDDLAQNLYDPTSPLYHHFLTSQERIERFAPMQSDFNKVAYFVQKAGLKITDSMPDRSIITASGTVGQIETAFNVHIGNYRKADASTFFAPDSDPSLPQSIAPMISFIGGLTDAGKPATSSVLSPAHNQTSSPADFKSLAAKTATPDSQDEWSFINQYGIPADEIGNVYSASLVSGSTPLNGAGQGIDLVEFGGFDYNDIVYYVAANNNLGYGMTLDNSRILLNTVDSDGSENQYTPECEEDMEMVEALASGTSGLGVYEGNGNGNMNQVLAEIVYNDDAGIVSSSYVEYEESIAASDKATFDYLTEEMAIQGQAFFAATGDNGSNPPLDGMPGPISVNAWASSPYQTAVGGTTLYIDPNDDGNYLGYYGENAWNNSGYATGGGISLIETVPTYQATYFASDPKLNSQIINYYRNVPDVALDADPSYGYYVRVEGQDVRGGGTSLSTPLWASYWAIVDQWRGMIGESNLGFANPALYSVASTPSYSSDFHDVISGNNGKWIASPTFDDCTGLGSFNGLNLLITLDGYGGPGSVFQDMQAPASAQSGQTITLTADLVDATPAGVGNAPVVTFYRQNNDGSWSQIGQTTVAADGATMSGSINYTLPDTTTPAQYVWGATVTLGSASSGPVQLLAATQVSPNAISSLSLSAGTLTAGQVATGTVKLAQTAVQNEQIDLSTTGGVSIPGSVTVTQGQNSAIFNVTALTESADTPFTLTAKADASSGLATGSSQSASGTVTKVAATLSSVKLTATIIAGGKQVTGTVSLTGKAASAATIALSSSNTALATVPATITVPAGSSSAKFTVTTYTVTAKWTANITASYGSSSASASLTVKPVASPELKSVSAVPATLLGGTPTTIKLLLTKPATRDMTVKLTTTDSVTAPVPATITIPAGAISASFTITTAKVTATETVTITAKDNGISKTAALTINPIAKLSGLSLNPTAIQGGQTGGGTVTVSVPTSNGEAIALASSNPSVASVPATVTIAGGATTATFAITTTDLAMNTSVNISATYLGTKKTVNLTVNH